MEESSTIQVFLEEGRLKGLAEEARRIIMLQGPMRFGAADEQRGNPVSVHHFCTKWY